MMDDRERAAWVAVYATASDGAWPEDVEKVEKELVRDIDAEVLKASTRPIQRFTGRARVVFADGTEAPWRTEDERGFE